MTLQKLLQGLRGELSQAEFADQVGISKSYYFELEKGKKQPSKKIIEQIVAARSLSKDRHNELLVAAGYAPTGDIDLDHPLLRKVVLALNNNNLPAHVQQKMQQDIAAVIDGWEGYVNAKETNYLRKWPATKENCEKQINSITGLLSRLSAYLLDAQGTAFLHLAEGHRAEEIHRRNALTIKQIPEPFKDPFLAALNLVHQGDVYRDQGQWKDAEDMYKEAQVQFDLLLQDDLHAGRRDRDDPSLRAIWARRKVASIALFRGNWKHAKRDLEHCRQQLQDLQNVNEAVRNYELAKTYYILGWAYNLAGEWDKAYQHHKDGLALAEKHRVNGEPDNYLLMLGYSYLGNDHRQSKSYDLAKENFENALKQFKPNNRENGWIHLGLARVYHYLGNRALKLGDSETAQGHFETAKQFFEDAENDHYRIRYRFRLVMTLTHYAWFLLDVYQDAAKAEERLQRALTLAQALNSAYYEAEIQVYLCELSRRKKQYTAIARLANEVEELHEKFTYHQFMAYLRAVQAKASVDQADYASASALYGRSFGHACFYNQDLIQDIETHLDQSVKEMITNKYLRPDAASEFYGDIVEALEELFADEVSSDKPTYWGHEEEIKEARVRTGKLTEGMRKIAQDVEKRIPPAYDVS